MKTQKTTSPAARDTNPTTPAKAFPICRCGQRFAPPSSQPNAELCFDCHKSAKATLEGGRKPLTSGALATKLAAAKPIVKSAFQVSVERAWDEHLAATAVTLGASASDPLVVALAREAFAI